MYVQLLTNMMLWTVARGNTDLLQHKVSFHNNKHGRSLTEECFEVTVGSSSDEFTNSKTVYVSSHPTLTCPSTVTKSNWASTGLYSTSDDAFSITVSGNQVTARRTDSSGGWSLDLKLTCCSESANSDVICNTLMNLANAENAAKSKYSVSMRSCFSADTFNVAPEFENKWKSAVGAYSAVPSGSDAPTTSIDNKGVNGAWERTPYVKGTTLSQMEFGEIKGQGK